MGLKSHLYFYIWCCIEELGFLTSSSAALFIKYISIVPWFYCEFNIYSHRTPLQPINKINILTKEFNCFIPCIEDREREKKIKIFTLNRFKWFNYCPHSHFNLSPMGLACFLNEYIYCLIFNSAWP